MLVPPVQKAYAQAGLLPPEPVSPSTESPRVISQGAPVRPAVSWAPLPTVQFASRAVPAPDVTRVFARTSGWTGADGTYSLPLPDGRILWLFSDTLVGTVDRHGHRTLSEDVEPSPFGPRFLNNSIAIQDNADPESTRFPLPLRNGKYRNAFESPDGVGILWVAGAEVREDGSIDLLLNQYTKSDDPAFPFGKQVATWVANLTVGEDSVDVGSYRVLDDLSEVSGGLPGEEGPEMSWGAAVLTDGEWNYVYSAQVTTKDRSQRALVLARVPKGQLSDNNSWEYWSPTGWQSSPADAVLQPVGVANEMSVSKVEGGYVMITQSHLGTLHARVAHAPEGPWSPPRAIYDPPEIGGERVAYNAKAHPHASDERGLLISYNVNSFDIDESLHDAHVYRPRFVRLDWGTVRRWLAAWPQ